MRVEYNSDPTRPPDKRPAASVVRFDTVTPVARCKYNNRVNFNHSIWRYEFSPTRWFDALELIKLDSGGCVTFGPYINGQEISCERVLRAFVGSGVLRTYHSDISFKRFDHAAVPADTICQIHNTSTDPFWIGSWYSTGGNRALDESPHELKSRSDTRAEYERFATVRAQNGLSTEFNLKSSNGAGVANNLDLNPPETMVTAFADSQPKTRRKAIKIGCNANWFAWMMTFDELKWVSDSSVMKLEPGEYTSLHTHFNNEGPHEEIYWIMAGNARVMTEYRDVQLSRFDCAFFPTNNAHAIGNVGTDTLWVGAWGSRGGVEGEFDIANLEISKRPGQVEEYERVMAARKQRGLSLPPEVNVVN